MAIFMAMNAASIADLKAHSPQIIRSVEAGEPCVVTRRNKPVARILPFEESSQNDANRTHLGYDERVEVLGCITDPALEVSEWGDLSL